MNQAIASNHPIPTPAGFPVQWDNPADAALLWVYSPAYYAKPLLPLEFDLGALPPVLAGNQVFARYGAAFQSQARLINGYLFQATRYLPETYDGAQAPLPDWRAEEIIPVISNVQQRWESAWLPEIQTHLAAWQAFDLTSATLPALVSHLDESVQRIDRLQELHIEVGVVFFTAIHHFAEWLQGALGAEVDVYPLLAGFESTGARSSQALWQLSRLALMQPEVYWILRESPIEQLLPALSESDEGQEFLAAFQEFLQSYGYQGDKNYLSQPTWAEEPTPVLQMLRGYVTQPQRDLTADLHLTADRRTSEVALIRQRLAALPKVDLAHFEFLLQAAQEGTWLREEHPHWLDLRIYAATRQVVNEIGRRFVQAGLLAAAPDIFYLTLAEVRQLLTQASPQQALVAQRRAQQKVYAGYTPPTLLGSLPAQPLPNHPLLAAMAQNTAELSLPAAKPQAPSRPAVASTASATGERDWGELRGHAASAGCVRGRARLIASPAEASQLRADDILVTANTTPAWTAIFANIAGLVTDNGGILSHAAVVAREFGIPAVVGTRSATTLIKEGQLIEVNGAEGMVRLMA